jgi:polyisoprenoid-binding protein YceI
MRPIRHAALLAALLLPASVRAQESGFELGTQAGTRLWVEGGSNVRSWSCDATLVEASVTGAAVPANASAKEVSSAARRAALSIPVAKLDCRNGTMNEHMRKALKSDAHKSIEYRIAKWELVPRGDDEGTVTTSGTLVIAGAEKPISVELTAKRGGQGTWQLKGSKTIRMTEWGVKPPSLMFGTMKVHDPVTIRFELVLEPK